MRYVSSIAVTRGTVATYQNRVMGFHDYGVDAVTSYVESNDVKASALQWRDSISQALSGIAK